jgi:MOSC domain-containing protein YiiM
MPNPRVEAVFIAPVKGGQAQAVAEVDAVAGAGLAGDRYSVDPAVGRDGHSCDVTLIEAEAIEAVARDCGVDLDAGAARRNIVTRDVPLNHLVGRTFSVGQVVLRGIAISEPCSYLAGLTYPEITKHLAHRAGLEAAIIESGPIRPGDPITY